MRKWLYDPKNDFKGEIFDGEVEIAQAKDLGWLEAPYSDMNVVEINSKVPYSSTIITNLVETSDNVVCSEPKLPVKPGRKPNATKAGKVKKDGK